MLTWLRIIVSCFCLVLCVLFAALWVRSYSSGDTIRYAQRSEIDFDNDTKVMPGDLWSATSGDGIVLLKHQSGSSDSADWTVNYFPEVTPWFGGTNFFGFAFLQYNSPNADASATAVGMPHWFLVLLIATISLVVKPKPRFRFGLRELFVLSTVGAITVGTLVIVLRALSE
jgi:hypothetical protein